MLLHFCRFHVNCQFCRCHCHFLGEKILSCFVPNLTPVCERCVLTYSHYFDVFFYVQRQP
jgi:hypothetical protein